jgi:hypothetical protein
MKNKGIHEGRGVVVDYDNFSITIYAEIKDWAQDAEGNPRPCGMKYALEGVDTEKMATTSMEEYQKIVNLLETHGMKRLGIKAGQAKLISAAQYEKFMGESLKINLAKT